jgi:hypothetical protein
MRKTILVALAALLSFGGAALAGSETWLVTEENTAGIKGSQGTWAVNVEGGKVSGAATMRGNDGTQSTYKVDGSIEGGVYTIKLSDRSDGKTGCVWSGHVPAGGGTQTKGLIGYAECENAKLILRVSIMGQ